MYTVASSLNQTEVERSVVNPVTCSIAKYKSWRARFRIARILEREESYGCELLLTFVIADKHVP